MTKHNVVDRVASREFALWAINTEFLYLAVIDPKRPIKDVVEATIEDYYSQFGYFEVNYWTKLNLGKQLRLERLEYARQDND